MSAANIHEELYNVCNATLPDEERLTRAKELLASGASPRYDGAPNADRATALHAAARRGPLALVEALIAAGALEWAQDANGRTPEDVARDEATTCAEREAIAELLARPVIRDASFKRAVAAIHAGDAAALAEILDAEPRLLKERAIEPECYHLADKSSYFLDPKLFWFVAFNPTPRCVVPDTICDVARVMLARGVDLDDINYTLGLVMTGNQLAQHGTQRAMAELLVGAGAVNNETELDALVGQAPLTTLLRGHETPFDAGRYQTLLSSASAADIQRAFGFAVIHGRVEAARLALDAGADVNAFLPWHKHSTALHQAVLQDEDPLPMLELLIARGADRSIQDTMWSGTPLGWSIHEGKDVARAYLESLSYA